MRGQLSVGAAVLVALGACTSTRDLGWLPDGGSGGGTADAGPGPGGQGGPSGGTTGAGGTGGVGPGTGGTAAGSGGAGCQSTGGVTGGSLAATFDGTPVTFTTVDSYYEVLDQSHLRIWVRGHIENPDCHYLTLGLTVPAYSTSLDATCLSFGTADAPGSLGFAYGASGSGMYYISNNTPGTCSGSFPVVPPEGYGHFMGTFEAILELPGTSSRVMLTSGSVDVMVPTI